MTDVIIQHLITNQKVRIKCKDLVSITFFFLSTKIMDCNDTIAEITSISGMPNRSVSEQISCAVT